VTTLGLEILTTVGKYSEPRRPADAAVVDLIWRMLLCPAFDSLAISIRIVTLVVVTTPSLMLRAIPAATSPVVQYGKPWSSNLVGPRR
jgi:hypothetical protein